MSETHRSPWIRANAVAARACADCASAFRDVLDLLAAGADRAEILADYPLLENGDIAAALEYAARQSDHLVLHAA